MKKLSPSLLRQRGLTIIEMLIGVAVGMIVIAGAINLMMNTLGSNRRLLLETRVNQDLRAAADLIARDLRRAGYWRNATTGVFSATGGAPTPNPYVGLTLNSNVIEYQYARDPNDTIEDGERAGFRLASGVLEFRNGASAWQPITDPKVLTVTTFTINELATPRIVELYAYCACMTKLTCDAAEFQPGGTYYAPTNPSIPTRPTLTIRHYKVVLAGQSTADAAVRREINETVRVRNDRLNGTCPNV